VGSALVELVTGGSPLATLVRVLVVICGLVLGLIYRRYLLLLGADRRKPAERQAYDGLRESLAEGNMAARLYADRLARFLDWVDRFFGDAGIPDRTLFPHAFWLKTPAPLWTAPAFDRCLLLALIYPIATICAVWAVSGHVGPAETALQLAPNMPGWKRGLLGVLFLVTTAGTLHSVRMTSWKLFLWLVFGAAAMGVGGWPAPVGILGAFAFASVGAVSIAVSATGVGAVGVAVVVVDAFGLAVHSTVAVAVVIAVAVAAVIVVAVFWASTTAISRGWQGPFLSFFVAMMIATCLMAARLLSSLDRWDAAGPLLLFIGLLTLLNAPFDWASLGLTRALLRRGLELGTWWPYALALVDACLAAVIIALLALTMLVGVQAFDALAVYGGGTPVLLLDPLFTGITAHPRAPEYWWLYALLFSTMIPSLVNLVIGGTSLVRGVPGVPSLILRYIPERGGVLKWDRHWIATVLTAQVAAGAALGIAAQVFLVWVIIGYVMPGFGADLLQMAESVTDFNLPARVGQLFGVSL
jgi:hypothetical protein